MRYEEGRREAAFHVSLLYTSKIELTEQREWRRRERGWGLRDERRAQTVKGRREQAK